MYYTSELKTNIMLALLQNGASVSELAQQYHINSKTIYRWKKRFLESAALIFCAKPTMPVQKKQVTTLLRKKVILQKKLELVVKQKDNILEQYQHFVAIHDATKNFVFTFQECSSRNHCTL